MKVTNCVRQHRRHHILEIVCTFSVTLSSSYLERFVLISGPLPDRRGLCLPGPGPGPDRAGRQEGGARGRDQGHRGKGGRHQGPDGRPQDKALRKVRKRHQPRGRRGVHFVIGTAEYEFLFCTRSHPRAVNYVLNNRLIPHMLKIKKVCDLWKFSDFFCLIALVLLLFFLLPSFFPHVYMRGNRMRNMNSIRGSS
jgi:hypothetical protein